MAVLYAHRRRYSFDTTPRLESRSLPSASANVVLRLACRAGLRDRVHGAHVLRRSLASRMLNAGATLKQIADFLGHTSIDTTTLYAKVDLATLSRVALPWPERKGVRP